jgi:DNA-directed RNA polymerase, sigma subunit (sigma70/sigma32)
MAVMQPDMLEATAERLLREAFERAEPAAAPVRAEASRVEDVEPTDAELAELSAEEEDALYGKGAGRYGGADGSEGAFQSYLHDIRGLSLLSHEEEIILAKRGQAGDTRARRRLVEANLRLVIAIARRYTNSGVPLIDLSRKATSV